MASFHPTTELLRIIAEALDRDLADPAVVAAFDRLVLRGQLVPWLPDWWGLMGWSISELERVMRPAVGVPPACFQRVRQAPGCVSQA